jgi:hypothetical protein
MSSRGGRRLRNAVWRSGRRYDQRQVGRGQEGRVVSRLPKQGPLATIPPWREHAPYQSPVCPAVALLLPLLAIKAIEREGHGTAMLHRDVWLGLGAVTVAAIGMPGQGVIGLPKDLDEAVYSGSAKLPVQAVCGSIPFVPYLWRVLLPEAPSQSPQLGDRGPPRLLQHFPQCPGSSGLGVMVALLGLPHSSTSPLLPAKVRPFSRVGLRSRLSAVRCGPTYPAQPGRRCRSVPRTGPRGRDQLFVYLQRLIGEPGLLLPMRTFLLDRAICSSRTRDNPLGMGLKGGTISG